MQGLDRYAYVNNSPLNYVDPSGHFTCSNDRNSDDYCPGRGGGLGSSGGGDNPLMGCQIHCSRDDIAGATLQERYDWFAWLREEMNAYSSGLGDWFVNIQTVIEGFYITGQDGNEWVLSVDVDILYAVQEGYATYTDRGTPSTRGGQEWYTFFQMASNNASDEQLLHQWGVAEFWGTNDGLYNAGLPYQKDDINFTIIGTVYRMAHFTACYAIDCVNDLGGFFNPKTTINGMISNNTIAN